MDGSTTKAKQRRVAAEESFMKPVEREPLKIVVTDLIDQGLINTPVTVFGMHSGKRLSARLTPDGTFVHRGNTYSSPSVAAGRVITAELGVSSVGRTYLSING